jgi:hypothetical protein
MRNKRFIACATLPTRMLLFAVVVLALVASGLAKVYEEPKSFSFERQIRGTG